MATEMRETLPASMAPAAQEPAGAEPSPKVPPTEIPAVASIEALAVASAEAPTDALELARNTAPPAGEISLAEHAPPAEDTNTPDTLFRQSIADVNASQGDPSWGPIIDIVPPLAMSEIGDDDNHQSGVEGSLPSALFVIPFPAPVNSHRAKNTPPFLMYSPPRSVYQKPPKTEDGKRPKEKIMKKVVRMWQEEVVMGEKIKRGELENPGRFKKIRGGCIRVASSINKWLPNSCIETLGRLPPKRKLGGVTIIHPSFSQTLEETVAEDQDRPYQPTSDELLNDIGVLLRKTRKRVLTRAILSGMLLPISLGIDVFAPVFAFEINMTYFAFQLYGLKKCNALTAAPKKQKNKRAKRFKQKGTSTSEEATLLVGNSPAQVPHDQPQPDSPEEIFHLKPVVQHSLDPIMVLLYNICAKIDPVSFPPLVTGEAQGINLDSPPSSQASTLPPSLKKPGGAVVKEMIEAFRETLPPEVTERYLLDEERLSEDLARYLKKASKEYIESLSGRGSRKGVIHRVKTWKQNSSSKKEQKAEKSRLKKQAKKQRKEAKQHTEPSAP
ncbi:hypothetical protein PtB15_2B623 [Puccinia triticina]|nr:hypothetical protein PtB15_2B623 [Puccinia triticina]